MIRCRQCFCFLWVSDSAGGGTHLWFFSIFVDGGHGIGTGNVSNASTLGAFSSILAQEIPLTS